MNSSNAAGQRAISNIFAPVNPRPPSDLDFDDAGTKIPTHLSSKTSQHSQQPNSNNEIQSERLPLANPSPDKKTRKTLTAIVRPPEDVKLMAIPLSKKDQTPTPTVPNHIQQHPRADAYLLAKVEYESLLDVAAVGVLLAFLSGILLFCCFWYLRTLSFAFNFSLHVCQAWILAALYAVYLIEGVLMVRLFCKLRERSGADTRLKVMKVKSYSTGLIFNVSLAFAVLVFMNKPLEVTKEGMALIEDSYRFLLPSAAAASSLVDLFASWYFVYPPCKTRDQGSTTQNDQAGHTVILCLFSAVVLTILAVVALCRAVWSSTGKRNPPMTNPEPRSLPRSIETYRASS